MCLVGNNGDIFMVLTNNEIGLLIAKALKARETAYCPRSHYAVGAAVLVEDGAMVSAANVEAETSTLQNCAERLALAKAFLDGFRMVRALAVVTEDGLSPCGTCRQIMYELCSEAHVIIAKTDGTYTQTTVRELLPFPFKRSACCR